MSREKRLNRRLAVLFLATIIAVGIVAGFTLFYIFPAYWFRWYPLIPAYFTLLGFVMVLGINRYSKRTPREAVVSFLIMRGIKMALTLGVALLYYLLIGEAVIQMTLWMTGFYFFTLFAEIFMFYRWKIK